MPTKITEDMTLGEILDINPGLAQVLIACGMYCISCPATQFETLEEAAWVHGLDVDMLLETLNNYLAGQQAGS